MTDFDGHSSKPYATTISSDGKFLLDNPTSHNSLTSGELLTENISSVGISKLYIYTIEYLQYLQYLQHNVATAYYTKLIRLVVEQQLIEQHSVLDLVRKHIFYTIT